MTLKRKALRQLAQRMRLFGLTYREIDFVLFGDAGRWGWRSRWLLKGRK